MRMKLYLDEDREGVPVTSIEEGKKLAAKQMYNWRAEIRSNIGGSWHLVWVKYNAAGLVRHILTSGVLPRIQGLRP